MNTTPGLSSENEPHITLAELKPAHWPAVAAIYGQGLATGNATFETAIPEWEQWDAAHLACCRVVAQEGQNVLGWAALSPVSRRRVYAGAAEVTVYVARDAQRRGIGSMLLAKLVQSSEGEGLWTLQSSIFPENVPSLRLHERHGFRVVGVRERLACHDGRWRDVLLMERRSKIAGV